MSLTPLLCNSQVSLRIKRLKLRSHLHHQAQPGDLSRAPTVHASSPVLPGGTGMVRGWAGLLWWAQTTPHRGQVARETPQPYTRDSSSSKGPAQPADTALLEPEVPTSHRSGVPVAGLWHLQELRPCCEPCTGGGSRAGSCCLQSLQRPSWDCSRTQ